MISTRIARRRGSPASAGTGLLARLAAWLAGFPRAGENVPVTVAFRVHEGREHWQRTFAGRAFANVQEEGRGRFERLLCERFGPLNFGMALVLDGAACGSWSGAGALSVSHAAGLGAARQLVRIRRGRPLSFSREIGHPLTGLIVGYRGCGAAGVTPVCALR